MASFRRERIANLIREEVSRLILQGEIKDPRVDCLVSIHRVEVSRDLDTARIYVGGFLDNDVLETSVEGLNSAGGFVQARLAKAIQTRNTPKVRFFPDHSIEEGFDVNRRLSGLETGGAETTSAERPHERTDSSGQT